MVTGKVLRPFTHKGKAYKEGDEILLKPKIAGTYEGAGRISLKKADVKVVEQANEKLAEKVQKDIEAAKTTNVPATNVTTTKTPAKKASKK